MLTRENKVRMLGNQIGRGFSEETKLLGHVWTRDERGVAVCANCGCVAKAADEIWRAECQKKEP